MALRSRIARRPRRITRLLREFGVGSAALTVAVLGIAIMVLGCSRQERRFESTLTYEPPLSRRVVVETVVDRPFEATWDALIRRLSESKFRIATLEKASRFVDVQLELSSDAVATANRPARYVDCGQTTRTLKTHLDEEFYVYEVAASSYHRESRPIPDGFRVSDVDRRVGLEAQASLYLEPEGETRTRVMVNARYALTIEIAGSAVDHPTSPFRGPSEPIGFGPRTESIRFTSFKLGRDKRSEALSCRVTGEFEHALIALANPAAAI